MEPHDKLIDIKLHSLVLQQSFILCFDITVIIFLCKTTMASLVKFILIYWGKDQRSLRSLMRILLSQRGLIVVHISNFLNISFKLSIGVKNCLTGLKGRYVHSKLFSQQQRYYKFKFIPIPVIISGVTSLSQGLNNLALKYCKIFCFKKTGELSILFKLPFIRYFFALLAA